VIIFSHSIIIDLADYIAQKNLLFSRSMALALKNIDAIIFDIGNVLVDIDYEFMISQFGKIANMDFHQIVTYSHQDKLFDQYEKGQISSASFRDALRKYIKPGVTDEEIDAAWNSILILYPPAKFDLLGRLREKYKIFALSNINDLHAAAIDLQVQNLFRAKDMRSYFDYAYYSYEMGQRKPEKEIYQRVLDEQSLNPSRTLFIDDKLENTNAAAALGIQVHHLTDRDALLDLFES
jgi:putative hydrolase of the HAD superfamily